MAHLSDSELKELKERAHKAWLNGAFLAHAEHHIMDLIDEVLELRAGGKKNALKEKAPEVVAPKVEVAPEAPKAPEKEPENDLNAKSEPEDSEKLPKSFKPSTSKKK